MAFRDHLGAAAIESSQISLIHEMMHHSQASGHAMTVFDNITECPGHRAAVNMLTRDRLCAAIGIEPEAYIDTLGWAMDHPSQPVLIDKEKAPCYENFPTPPTSPPSLFRTIGHRTEAGILPQASSLHRTTASGTSPSTVNFCVTPIIWSFAWSPDICERWS